MTASRCYKNVHVDREAVQAPEPDSYAYHATLPGFSETPLRSAPGIAKRLGVRSVTVKNESSRLETPSFKILGASWATYRTLLDHYGVEPDASPSLDQLKQVVAEHGKDLVLVAATDGNHGRAVARMAKILGVPAIILVPEVTVQARIDGITSEGAEVRIVEGGYDQAIEASAALADENHVVISDTSWPGYEKTPRWVIDGYSTMLHEVTSAIDAGTIPEPTVVAAQMGVGAFSSAVARAFAPRPARLLVGVEPISADCVITSVEAGHVLTIDGAQDSSMAGLNCGTPSIIAFDDNLHGFDAYVTVADDDADEAIRLLHADGIDAGESGAAGLAGLLAQGEALELGPNDDVFLFLTEGPTDPVNFNRIIGAGQE